MDNLDILSLNIEKHLPRLKTSSDYWLVRTESGDYYEDFIRGSYIGLGWNLIDKEIIDDTGMNASSLKEKVEKLYENDNVPGRTANQVISFIDDIKIGDLVLIPSKSSEVYMLGEVTSNLYYEKDSDLTDGMKRCPFIKRRKVKWIKSFYKKDADNKILKLSYRQQTVNEINEYKTIINRALYDAYIDDDDFLHLTFGINIEENINMIQLSNFLYYYTQIYEVVSDDQNIDIKINAQSKGKSEIITKVTSGIVVAGLIYGVCLLPYGGDITIGGGIFPEIAIVTPGIITEKERIEKEKIETQIKKEQADSKNTAQDLENLEKAYELSEKMKIPIQSLNVAIPEEFIDALNKAKKEDTSNMVESADTLKDINSDE